MKGCIRGYGNYEELTSSGVDPTELFDDIEDCKKSPDLVQPDIVIEDCDDVVVEEADQELKSPDHVRLLPIEKARRRVRSRHSDSNDVPNFNRNFDPLSEEVSLCTAPSLFSLVSTHDNLDSIRGTKKVVPIASTKILVSHDMISLHYRTCSMLYQKRRGLMEVFQTKRISDISRKVEIQY